MMLPQPREINVDNINEPYTRFQPGKLAPLSDGLLKGGRFNLKYAQFEVFARRPYTIMKNDAAVWTEEKKLY